ncbi:MAG: SDR family oxidoreductase [Candidatus Heimdallarchaeota archaeon]
MNYLDEADPILITGAGSGIGKLTAEHLSRRGKIVYASARSEKDVKYLNTLRNVLAFHLDVTSSKDVRETVKQVEEEGRGLYGLINNAGVADFWPIIATDEKMLHRVFDVNVYGPLRVTNALIPYIVKSKGRIVNISSISGLFTPMFMSSYSMSKYAFESWSDALSQELRELGVKVVIIEPGTFNTKIIMSTAEMVRERAKKPQSSIANSQISWITQNITRETKKRLNSPTPEKVVNAIMDGLFAPKPKKRYLVTSKKTGYEKMLYFMIKRLVQFFHDNEYELTKDDLFKMLDNAFMAINNPKADVLTQI